MHWEEPPTSGCVSVCSGSRYHMYDFFPEGITSVLFQSRWNPCPSTLGTGDRCREVTATLPSTTDPEINNRDCCKPTHSLDVFLKLCLEFKKKKSMPCNTLQIIKSSLNPISEIIDIKIGPEVSFGIHLDRSIGLPCSFPWLPQLLIFPFNDWEPNTQSYPSKFSLGRSWEFSDITS